MTAMDKDISEPRSSRIGENASMMSTTATTTQITSEHHSSSSSNTTHTTPSPPSSPCISPKSGCKPRDVRILLVGDAGVGKTSLIYSLVSEEYSEEVPAKSEEITIPPDVTPDNVTTQIVDYSDQEQSQQELFVELAKASVICIVYAVDDDDTIDRITNYWLPIIRDTLGEDHKKPVVLVGNKSDLVEYSSLDVILPVMNSYPEVETCVECSAKSLKNIAEVFFYAQKAVLHPTSPLYSSELRDLTDNCKRALGRIFKLCDENNDGLLSDDELNAFQVKCFGSPLQPQALEDVKCIVKRTIRDGIFDDSLTLTGFLFLHTLFIQRGRHETTWTVLRKFGYNDSVLLDESYLRPPIFVPSGCSVELTSSGYKFLTSLFNKYDSDGDGCLSPSEIESFFSLTPATPSYFESKFLIDSVSTNDLGWVTLKGFLSVWTLITHLEPNITLEYLAYLGYTVLTNEESQLTAIQVTRDKRVDLQTRQTSRNVFSCHVIGPQGAGKSSLMKGFLGHSLAKQNSIKERIRQGFYNSNCNSKKSSSVNHNTSSSSVSSNFSRQSHALGLAPSTSTTSITSTSSINNLIKPISLLANYSVNSVTIYGQEKYLIIREVDVFSLTERLAEPELLCDVVCLTYDLSNPKSFEYIARIYLKHFYDCRLPVQILGMKADKGIVLQEYFIQPEEFCERYKLPKPEVFTVVNSNATSSLTDGNNSASCNLNGSKDFAGCFAAASSSAVVNNVQVPNDIYLKLATMAAYPTLRRLVHVLALKPTANWMSSHFNALQRIMPEPTTLVRAGIGLSALAIASFFLMRLIRSNNSFGR